MDNMQVKRRSSVKLTSIGAWSVKGTAGYIVKNTSESKAWQVFLGTIEDARLIKGDMVMSERTSTSPINVGRYDFR
jgi:hypothetical protein